MGRERRQDSNGARLRGLPMGLSLSLALRKYLAVYPGSQSRMPIPAHTWADTSNPDLPCEDRNGPDPPRLNEDHVTTPTWTCTNMYIGHSLPPQTWSLQYRCVCLHMHTQGCIHMCSMCVHNIYVSKRSAHP